MKRTLFLLLVIEGILLLPVLFSSSPTVVHSVSQATIPPTVLIYLPFVAKNCSLAPAPTPSNTPTVTVAPTGTPTPTPTSTPTLTPTATHAPTATPTATSEPGELPSPPLLVAPPNGAQLDTISPSFTIDNSAIGQAAWAGLEAAFDPAFTAIAFDFQYAPFSGSNTAPLFWNLEEGTTYYWRARSSLDEVNWGHWSEVWSFTTASGGTVPGAPTLVSPANGNTVSSLRPTLTWSSVAGATRYAISVTSETSGYTFFSSLPEFTFHFDLDTDTAYEWSVRARNDYGWGADSEEWTFITPSSQSTSGSNAASASIHFFEITGGTRILHVVSDQLSARGPDKR